MSDEKQLTSTRDGVGQGLLEAAADHPKVIGLCADLTESTRLQWFAQQYPERFFQLGVAEQNLAGVAAGLALGGYMPVAASYACFHPANSWGVIRTSICYSNLNVTLIGGHAGLVTGEDGATHQSLEDIATMRVLPNMTVLVPGDAQQARQAIRAAIEHTGPVYIRTSKATATELPRSEDAFTISKAHTIRDGTDLTMIGCGTILTRSLQAAVILEHYHGISTR
ncbi:MAG: transketolase family protein, partial [Patescibacteria group bacterium]